MDVNRIICGDIARVFPIKTNMSPTDEHAYFGIPPNLFKEPKQYKEIHISIAFTQYLDNCDWEHWWKKYGTVKIGGPACGDPGGEFVPGMYLRQGVTITSRGCCWKCPFCFVPKREGEIRELEIHEGNIVQDNNLLACSKSHQRKVFEMLKTQRAIDFSGGLDCRLMSDWALEQLRGLKIKQLWFAYDNKNNLAALKKTAERLTKYFKRDKLRCYVLIGYKNDTIDKAEGRLRQVWELGYLPFAMLYQPGMYTKDWHDLQRNWSRPAITKKIMGPEQKSGQMPLFK